MLYCCLTLMLSGVLGDFIGRYALYYSLLLRYEELIDSYSILDMDASLLEVKKPKLIHSWSIRRCCGQTASGLEKIPLLSVIVFFKKDIYFGKCHYCHARLSWTVPLCTLFAVILTSILLSRYGFTQYSLWLLVFFLNLILLSAIDFAERLLPDLFTLGFLWIGLLLNTKNTFCVLNNAVIASALGYAVPFLCASLYTLFRKKEAMGRGDFKLYAMIGAWFGLKILIHTWVLSMLLGGVVAIGMMMKKTLSQNQEMPFGPVISLAAFLSVMGGSFLWHI